MKQDKTVLVTGAAGFIGGRVVERLHFDGLANGRAGVHRWSSAARISRIPVDILKFDVLDKDNLPHVIDGSDFIVHCAYGDRSVTKEGTRNLLQAALDAGVERFVHLSTVEVYGNVSGQIDESMPMKYSGNPYADSKIEAEKACIEFRRKGLSVVILRPTIVYGPFSKLWSVRSVQLLHSGWGNITGLNGICNHLYVDDLVSAIILSLFNKSADNETFNISGLDPVTWAEFFDRFSSTIGLPLHKPKSFWQAYFRAYTISPVRKVARQIMNTHPEVVLTTTSRWPLLKGIARYTEKQIRSTPSAGELALYKRNAVYSIDKAKSSLGYLPKFDLNRGLQLNAAWLRHHGYLHTDNGDYRE